MDSKPIAVFGATGFLGRHVVAKLLAEGHQVRAIARSHFPTPLSNLESHALDVGAADVGELVEAIRGCGTVVNLVGIKRESSSQTFSAVHVRFVDRLLAAIGDAGIAHIVHVSVVSARPDAWSAYHDTKWQAEESIRASGIAYTILRPGVIYGQGDDLLGHLTKMIRASGVFPIVGDGLTQQQPVDVTDVAAAIAASVQAPAAGKTYSVVGPEPLTLRDIVGKVAEALDLKVRIVSTPPALMRPAVHLMNRLMKNPLSTPAQLQMLIDGMTGDPEPMRRDLGVDPQPFTVERIRATARQCETRLPFDLRLSGKGDGKGASIRRFWTLAVTGTIVMNIAFLLPTRDTWTRVVAGIVFLGAMAAPGVWRQRRTLLRVDSFSIAMGLASGLGLYGVARMMTRIPAIALETDRVSTWRDGHSLGALFVTLTIAVVSEELFWRGEITQMLGARFPKWSAAVLATLIFSVAHIGSGTWLLPIAAAGIVLTWSMLFVVTGSLVAPILSHFAFDLLAMLVLPLGGGK